MLYLANGSSPVVRTAMTAGELGQLCTPRERREPLPGVTWAADNGCFGSGYPGDALWVAWLRRHSSHVERCLFATAPDVVGDAKATSERSARWLPVIRELGYRASLVAQDGLEDLDVPWETFDALFLGGTTDWKLSAAARDLTGEAVARRVPVHMGRVNSRRRLLYAKTIGCTSADGTFLSFGPDHNLDRFRRWTHNAHPTEERR